MICINKCDASIFPFNRLGASESRGLRPLRPARARLRWHWQTPSRRARPGLGPESLPDAAAAVRPKTVTRTLSAPSSRACVTAEHDLPRSMIPSPSAALPGADTGRGKPHHINFLHRPRLPAGLWETLGVSEQSPKLKIQQIMKARELNLPKILGTQELNECKNTVHHNNTSPLVWNHGRRTCRLCHCSQMSARKPRSSGCSTS